MPVIEIQDLHYAYPPLLPQDEPQPVLRGVDLVVEKGEFLAIMGATGAGKSTLCMAINGLVPQSTGGYFRGRVRTLGNDTRRIPVASLAAQVSMVYQDPESQLFCSSVEDEIAFGPENLGVSPAEIDERVGWALHLVDMVGCRQRSPTRLSGGQKQRVAIAAALAMLPRILVLDEPTSGLDPVGQQEVFAVVERLRQQREMTIVMVSHNAEQIAQFADRIAILDEGVVKALDTPLRIFEDEPLLREAGLSAPQVTEAAMLLNKLHGTSFHFVALEEATKTLRSDLLGQRE